VNRVERDLWRVTLRQLWLTPRVGLSNLRFLIAMRLGGFISASRGCSRREEAGR